MSCGRPSADFQIAISFHSLPECDHNRADSGGFVEPEHLPAPDFRGCDRGAHPCKDWHHRPRILLLAQGHSLLAWFLVKIYSNFIITDLQQLHNSVAEKVIKEELEFKLCPGEILIFAPCRC